MAGNAADHPGMRRLLLVLVFAIGLAVPAFALGSDSPSPDAVAACKAEYTSLGADAFKAKYGAKEPYAACVVARGGKPETSTTATTTTTTSTTPKPSDSSAGARSIAGLMCTAEGKKIGKDAFLAKYGQKEPYGSCITANLTAAAQILSTCKSSAGSSKDAFEACVKAAVGSTRRS